MLDKYDRSSDAGRQGVYFSRIFDVVWIMDVIANISDFNIIVFSVFSMLIGWSPRKKKQAMLFFQGVNLPGRSKGGFCIRISQFHHFFLIESRFFALKKCHFLLVESTFLVNCLHFPPFLAAYFCWHLPSKYCWVPHWLYQIISFIIIFFSMVFPSQLVGGTIGSKKNTAILLLGTCAEEGE